MNPNEPPRPKGTQGQPPDKQEVAKAMNLAFYQFKLIYVRDIVFRVIPRAVINEGTSSLPQEMCFPRRHTSSLISTLSAISC